MTETKHHKFPITRGAAYGLITAYICVIAVACLSIWYSNHTNEENNRKWCHVLVAIDEVYKESSPQTITGKRIAEEFHQQRIDFHC